MWLGSCSSRPSQAWEAHVRDLPQWPFGGARLSTAAQANYHFGGYRLHWDFSPALLEVLTHTSALSWVSREQRLYD